MSPSQQNESIMMYVNSTVLTGVLVITIIVIFLINGRRKVILANRIPGPHGWYIVGRLKAAIDGPEFILKHFLNDYRKYEKSLFKFWILNRLYIVLTKPEYIELVLTDRKYVRKSEEYDVFQESVGGEGIFSIRDVNRWKINRKIITKGLNFELLKSFIPIMCEEANDLVEILQEKCDRKTNECDVIGPLSLTSIEIIGRTTMGVAFNAQRGGQNTFVENVHRVFRILEYRMSYPWFFNNLIFSFSSVKRQHDRSRKIINEFIHEIIKSKTIELNQSERANEMNTKTQKEDSDRKFKTIIEILLQNPQGMSYEQIRDEIITILIGGYETISMANSSTILMLALHQDIQDKVYEELQSIFPEDEDRYRPPTYEDLQHMKYLERVIKETLRLCPPVPLMGRKLNEETEIGGYQCPAGATLLVETLSLHTSPLYYDNPNRFDPDNFLPEVVGRRHPFTWIPFSAGVRNCIGIKFGMIEMKIVISTLLRRFKFFPSEKCPTIEHIRFMYMMTLNFVDGCHVRIEPRT